MARAKTAPQSVLLALANLAPGADKTELMRTIDAAVDDIIADVDDMGGAGSLPSDTQKLVQVTLQFLHACAAFKDPGFTKLARKRAKDLERAFEGAIALAKMRKMAAAMEPMDELEPDSYADLDSLGLGDLGAELEALSDAEDKRMARGPAQAPAKPPAKSEPTPKETSSAPKKKAKPEKKAKSAAETAPPASGEDFTLVLGETLAGYFHDRLSPFFTPPEKCAEPPFFFSAAFAEALRQGITEFVAPKIAEKKAMILVAHGLNEHGLTPETLLEAFKGPRKANRVWMLWDERMESFGKALAGKLDGGSNKTKGKATKPKGKPGLFAKLMGKEEPARKEPPKVSDNDAIIKDAKAFWKIIQTAAKKNGFVPPEKSDLAFLQMLFEFDDEKLSKAVTATQQVLHQEYTGEAREGASVDLLNDLMRKSSPHMAELIALWAHFNLDQMTPKILRAFQISQGRTKRERQERMPYLTRFAPDADDLK